MSKLNNDHISFIIKDLNAKGLILEGLHDEIIDHVCSAVDAEMEKGVRFSEAYQTVIKSFGDDAGLADTQQQTVESTAYTPKLMLKNYFKVAIRNISRQKFYAFINVSGLAFGIAACLLIVLYITFELSFDQYHAKADRIYRLNAEIKFAGNHYQLAVAPAPLGPTLVQEYPEVEAAVRFRSQGSYLVKRDGAAESFKEYDVIWTDSAFFQLFSIEVLEGNGASALREPNSVAISKKMAEKYFRNEAAVGQSLIFDGSLNLKVTAVYDDMPRNGHFRFDFLIAMAGLEEAQSPNFLSNNFNTYLLLREGSSAKELEKKLPAFVNKYVGPQAAQALGGDFTMEKFIAGGNKLEYTLINLLDIHLHSDLGVELSTNSDITYVYLFGAIAAFILVIACINFMNLSTARSANRAKEVGVRKVMGSMRSHLVRQFLTESVIITLLAFALAIGLAALVLPAFNSVAQMELALPGSVIFYLVIFLCAVFVGVLAGLYPSFFLSSIQPLRVMKGQLALGSKSGLIRGGLVVFQFAISIFLIIATITVDRQLNFIQNKKVGFNKDQVIMISDAYGLGDQIQSFKDKVEQNSMISSGTVSGFIPVSGGYRTDNTYWPDGSGPTEENMVGLQAWTVDHDYIKTMDMKIVEGRGFSKEFPADSGAVVLNQTAVKFFNLGSDPLGKKIATFAEGFDDGTVDAKAVRRFTVVGVVEDFHFESLKQNIGPLGFFLGRSAGYACFRFEAKNTRDVIDAIEKEWKSIAPGQPFQYSFLDDSFGRMYASERRLGKIFGGFAGLAIIIASLGLFALSAFTAEQRTKEIGIRKVLGASVSSIVVLLSREYGKLVLIAFVISAPLAWYAVDWWLRDYSYKVEIGVVIYLLAGVGAFLVAWLTMSFQSIKAATTNPVNSLRNE